MCKRKHLLSTQHLTVGEPRNFATHFNQVPSIDKSPTQHIFPGSSTQVVPQSCFPNQRSRKAAWPLNGVKIAPKKMSRSSEEGTQQTLTSVVAVIPPASLHQEALGKRQNLKIPLAHQENTPIPQPTPLLLQFLFLKCPSPSTAWPNSIASLMPGSAMLPRRALCRSGRQEGHGHLVLQRPTPTPPHPLWSYKTLSWSRL